MSEATIRVSGGTLRSFFKRSLLLDTVVAEATQRLVTTNRVSVDQNKIRDHLSIEIRVGHAYAKYAKYAEYAD